MTSFDNPTHREEEGIAAIILLQSMAGIEETRAQARAGWRAMTADDREVTLVLAATLREVA